MMVVPPFCDAHSMRCLSGFAPLRGLRRPFTPVPIRRKPGDDEPPPTSQVVAAVQSRQATVADPYGKIAERKPETPHDSLHSPDFLFYIAI